MTAQPSTAALALALLASRGVGERTLSRWLMWAGSRDEPAAYWLGKPPNKLIRVFPDKTESVAIALASLDAAALDRASRWVDRTLRAGGQLLLAGQSDYPAKLRTAGGTAAPPVLTVIGDTELLGRDAGAVVGSRTPSAPGLELARRCAEWLASRGRVVVSGGAQGVDAAAHEAALEGGGTTVVVLPQGILSHDVPATVATAIEDGNALLISQFVPDAGWTVGGAVTRNETIATLSRLVFVIEPLKPGGSLKTGRDTLAQRKRVLAYPAAGAGAALIREGAGTILDERGRFEPEHVEAAWAASADSPQDQIELL